MAVNWIGDDVAYWWAPAGAPETDRSRSRAGRTRNMVRETCAAWAVGMTIWLAGVTGMAVVPALAERLSDGAAAATASYYVPSRSYSLHQDLRGRYTVAVRGLVLASND